MNLVKSLSNKYNDILPDNLYGYIKMSKISPENILSNQYVYTGFCYKNKEDNREYEIYIYNGNIYHISIDNKNLRIGLPKLPDIIGYETQQPEQFQQMLPDFKYTGTTYKSFLTGYKYEIYISKKNLYYKIIRNSKETYKKYWKIPKDDIKNTLIRKNFIITDENTQGKDFSIKKDDMTDENNRKLLEKDNKILENSAFYANDGTYKEKVIIKGNLWYRYFHKETNRYYYVNITNYDQRWGVDKYNISIGHKLYKENKTSSLVLGDSEYKTIGYYYMDDIILKNKKKYVKIPEYIDENGIPCYVFSNFTSDGKETNYLVKYDSTELSPDQLRDFYSNLDDKKYIFDTMPKDKNIEDYGIWYLETVRMNGLKSSEYKLRNRKRRSKSFKKSPRYYLHR